MVFYQDLQDTSEYVKQELEALAQEQAALDKVAAKLEKELRGAMKNKGDSYSHILQPSLPTHTLYTTTQSL